MFDHRLNASFSWKAMRNPAFSFFFSRTTHCHQYMWSVRFGLKASPPSLLIRLKYEKVAHHRVDFRGGIFIQSPTETQK